MNYQAVEETIRAGYRQISAKYRQDDEVEVSTPNHRRISATLKELCAAFPHPIAALEVGCGTGRFFHALVNVEELTGLDISEDMLRNARNPVRQDQISVKKIELQCGNVYLASFPAESFHVIYSLGMFGNGCPVTTELCNKFHDWLAPGGKLFFNTVDISGQPLAYRAKRQAREWVYPILPQRFKNALDEREARHPMFSLTRRELQEILRQSRFEDFQITSHVCDSPLWEGRHLECVATKAE